MSLDVDPRATGGSAGLERSPSFFAVVTFIARRGLMRIMRVPTILVPAVIMPIFFLVAFSGTFSSITQVEGYGTDNAVNWFVAYSMLMGASFAGTGAAGAAAADLENGFFDRLRLSPVNPLAIVAGLLSYSVIRATLPTIGVMVVALLMGADFQGGILGIILPFIGAWGVASFIGLLGLSIVFRIKTTQSLAIIQIFIFTFMFLSIGQAPLAAIEGWLQPVARYNPITPVLRMVRQGFLGDVTWATTWPGLVSLVGLITAFGLLALSQLRTINT